MIFENPDQPKKNKLEDEITDYRSKCGKFECHIDNLESRFLAAKLFIEAQVRQKAEIELKAKHHQQDIYNKQELNLKDLQEKLRQAQEALKTQKKINQDKSFKLKAVSQCYKNLNKQQKQKEEQQQRDNYYRFKSEILQNQLSKTKIIVSKLREDVQFLEEFKKKAEIDFEEKQKKIDDYLNQLEILKKQIFGCTYNSQDEKEVDKLYFAFILKYQNNLNHKIYFSDEKMEDACQNHKDEIKKYKKIIEEFKNELTSSNVRFQKEEKINKEVQGKLFLIERNFESLKIFSSNELKNLKFYLKDEKRGRSEDIITFETKTKQNDALTSDEKKIKKEEFSKEMFCINQQKEMNKLHKEFENIFS